MLLTWDAPAEDAESVTGYRIKRRAPGKGQQYLRVLVADTGSTETIYLDTTTKNGVRYVYRVHALRGEVVSAELRRKEICKPCHSYAYAYSNGDRYGYTTPSCHGYIYTHRYAAHTNARV